MKKLFILFSLLLTSILLNAQDVIYTMDDVEIKAKVLEVKPDVVTYKKISNVNGPTYEIAKGNVHKIVYKNGEEEVFNKLNKDGKTGIQFTFFVNDTLFITNITKNSPADKAGLSVGDKIIRINETRVGYFKNNGKVQNLLDGIPNSFVEVEVLKAITTETRNYRLERKLETQFEEEKILPKNNATEETPLVKNTEKVINNQPRKNTTKTTNGWDVKNGFFGSYHLGIGGASFDRLEPFYVHNELEIGRVHPATNVLQSFKFNIISFVEDEVTLYSFKYGVAGYFGKYTKQGFFLGADFGLVAYPDGDIPLWDIALTGGYSFRLHRNIRLEIPASFNLWPTGSFSNIAVGGSAGIRLSGIL